MKKCCLAMAAVLGFFSVACIGTAVSTSFWINIRVRRNYTTNNGTEINCQDGTKSIGLFLSMEKIHTCLRWKSKTSYVWSDTDLTNSYSTRALIAVLACCGLSMVCGLVGTSISIFNVVRKPYQALAGPLGLYVTYSIGVLTAIAALSVFYITLLRSIRQDFFIDKRNLYIILSSKLGISFWLVVIASACFVSAISSVAIGESNARFLNKKGSMKTNEQLNGNVLMY